MARSWFLFYNGNHNTDVNRALARAAALSPHTRILRLGSSIYHGSGLIMASTGNGLDQHITPYLLFLTENGGIEGLIFSSSVDRRLVLILKDGASPFSRSPGLPLDTTIFMLFYVNCQPSTCVDMAYSQFLKIMFGASYHFIY